MGAPPSKRLLRLPRRPAYRVWSVKTITIVALVVISLTATSVALLGKRSIFRETELTLALIALALFVFLAVGLYRGVRVRKRDLPNVEVKDLSVSDVADAL